MTSRIDAGATSSVAYPLKKWVATTDSSPSFPRTPCAISSRPVASGNFLGALRPVTSPPTEVGPFLDLLLQLVDAVHERLGPRWAARHVHVDGQELVDALDNGVVVEHAGARGARAHRDDPLRFEHLVV